MRNSTFCRVRFNGSKLTVSGVSASILANAFAKAREDEKVLALRPDAPLEGPGGEALAEALVQALRSYGVMADAKTRTIRNQ